MINLDSNKLLNQITYLGIFKINKMPKTMHSVMFFNTVKWNIFASPNFRMFASKT